MEEVQNRLITDLNMLTAMNSKDSYLASKIQLILGFHISPIHWPCVSSGYFQSVFRGEVELSFHKLIRQQIRSSISNGAVTRALSVLVSIILV